jgi:hypothetical protein
MHDAAAQENDANVSSASIVLGLAFVPLDILGKFSGIWVFLG